MTNATYFIGRPDWRSALLAAAFALPWLLLLARGRLKRPWLWAALLAGAALFPVSIAWVQVPAQQALGSLWLRLLGEATVRRYALVLGLPGLTAGSLVQEGAKLLVAVAALALLGERRRARAGLALGAAAGAGYGGFEAFWVFNLILAGGWSWGLVQLAGPQALLGFAERFVTVPFHIGSAALAAYGYATGRPGRYLLLAVALHTLANYAALLFATGALGVVAVELWVALVAAGTIAAALWLRRRTVTPRPPTSVAALS